MSEIKLIDESLTRLSFFTEGGSKPAPKRGATLAMDEEARHRAETFTIPLLQGMREDRMNELFTDCSSSYE